MAAQNDLRSWTHQDEDSRTYLCSTDPGFLQLDALNAALGSDMLWWAKPLPLDRLKTMTDNSMILGLYLVESELQHQPGQGLYSSWVSHLDVISDSAHNAESRKCTMIGFARVITDRVTFGYLTDVYVLAEYQRRGLGTFLMTCLNDVLESWPELRAMWILTENPEAQKMYTKIFGAQDFFKSTDMSHRRLLEKKGPECSH